MFLDTKTIQWKLSRVETTQPARNVPGRSPEGALKIVMSGTSRGPLEDS